MDMNIVCLDLEGVLVPEIWIAFAEASGIPELKRTTRDEPDYDKLMKWRLGILKEHGLGLKEIQETIAKIDPIPGAKEFLDELRSITQVIIISDTFSQFAGPLMKKLGYPTIFCNSLEVADNGEITGFKMRVENSKYTTVKALQSIGFQTIASGGNRAPLSALRSVIAEDGKVLYQSFPQAERAVPAQAAYLTLWTMQQVVQRGTGRQLGAKYPNLHLAGKTGTTNNNVDTWFAGIDGSTVTITWVGRDNNQPTKLYGASGAMSIYQRYLANQTPTPLNLVPPEDIADMGVDYDGNFVCSGGMRVLPVWTSDPQSLCQQSEMQQQPSGNPFDQSSQPQQQPQQQPAQQEQKDSDGVAGWIKDMFGSN